MNDGEGATAYIDFSTKVQDIDTDIKILETSTHAFIYINQGEERMHLYDESLKNEISRSKIRPNKKLVVFCSVRTHEAFNDIKKIILDILTK
ncbi:hypothetical protein CWI42_020680 [Ordospora colligata]|uniref:Uncharacterized protein n=1 Tax=Ordospora colligata OC4 TaxID=1354746 RepID=A0A0B2ULN5_9MICR|nr:uncharacterized protein M896_020690 [Ordospora colligata OC4]KHN70233.1 hypothetical protein M896_020690 [Ordospora colligata OC4]TBU16777.1 hypothetical protein CWI41_020700 [Ordospora colligata]TBU17083.1 hypothetical protein CWI40_020700 [Ordospora colligata]TBU19326.1 hypothetical protein CWI42_020680 [Ordospora colligata]